MKTEASNDNIKKCDKISCKKVERIKMEGCMKEQGRAESGCYTVDNKWMEGMRCIKRAFLDIITMSNRDEKYDVEEKKKKKKKKEEEEKMMVMVMRKRRRRRRRRRRRSRRRR